jgi:hypothetical protein
VSFESKLDNIFNDEFAEEFFPKVRVKKSSAKPAPKLESIFNSINAFVDENGAAPLKDSDNGLERGLGVQLDVFKQKPDFKAAVLHLDKHNLLGGVESSVDNIECLDENAFEDLSEDDIFSDDIFDDVLGGENKLGLSLLGGERARRSHERSSVDQGNRRPCGDFDIYKERFLGYQKAMEDGNLVVSNERQSKISEGDLFLWDGFIALLTGERIDGDVAEHSGKRWHVVFSNGMEAWLREGSIVRSMYVNTDRGNKVMCRRLVNVSQNDLLGIGTVDESEVTGYIYVVRTLSDAPELAKVKKHAVKIGVTKNPVNVRLSNAESDPTFLCSPVDVISTYTLFNLKPMKVEEILHTFFAEARIRVNAKDRFGKGVSATEWFMVSPKSIEKAVKILFNDKLSEYKYNALSGKINKKD